MVDLIKKYRTIISYGIISVLVTLVDLALVRVLSLRGVRLVLANTAGVLTGSILQYLLNLRFSFRRAHSGRALAIHVLTFLMGLGLANLVMTTSYSLLMRRLQEAPSFYLAKGLSIVVPFFAMYIVRKTLYRRLPEEDVNE